MAENYKILYEQTKNMLTKYQDEIVPCLRKLVEDLEKNRADIVRCKECKYFYFSGEYEEYSCKNYPGLRGSLENDDFCSHGERESNEE